MAGEMGAFDTAATALEVVGELSISSRQITKLVKEAGSTMASERDARTRQYVDSLRPCETQPCETLSCETQPCVDSPLPSDVIPSDVIPSDVIPSDVIPSDVLPSDVLPEEPPLDLVAVFTDGGRMRTRTPDCGSGIHSPHWRETKNAAFHEMQSQSFDDDPQVELPDCFRNAAYVEKLVKGLKNMRKDGREEEEDSPSESSDSATDHGVKPSDPLSRWQPETQFRTCVSSLASSKDFGPMMAAEANARGFYAAKKKAFVGDGQAYNWTIQQQWFPKFKPIADFVHVVEYVYSLAKAVARDEASRWQLYLEWTTACWQGRVADVVESLRAWQTQLGVPGEGEKLAEHDPRKILQKTLTYLTNNCSRMDYPSYRRAGLPTTSSLAESLVKQVSKRVKGTEKFWNDGVSGEAILQLRAAVLSHGNQLAQWVQNRPISVFSPRCRPRLTANAP